MSDTPAESKVPYLTHARALELKAMALMVLQRPADNAAPHERDLVVTAHELLSLIDQAHSPQLGLATTKQLRDEFACRDADPLSRADDYRTLVPARFEAVGISAAHETAAVFVACARDPGCVLDDGHGGSCADIPF